jgi:hypothetical protein
MKQCSDTHTKLESRKVYFLSLEFSSSSFHESSVMGKKFDATLVFEQFSPGSQACSMYQDRESSSIL